LILDATRIDVTVRLYVAAGLRVDEVPSPVSLETPFGSYSLSYTNEGARITVRRTVSVRGGHVPVDEYPSVRVSLEKARTADAVPIVLVRK
jgi:hypothetical protein